MLTTIKAIEAFIIMLRLSIILDGAVDREKRQIFFRRERSYSGSRSLSRALYDLELTRDFVETMLQRVD